MSEAAELEIAYGVERDLEAWIARNAAGDGPSAWPYGLEKLARPNLAVRAVSLADVRRPQLALSHLLRGSRVARSNPRRISVAWDENVARRLFVRSSSRRELNSGVIWLTDAVRRKGAADYAESRRLLNKFTALYVLSRAQIEPLIDFLGPDAPPVSFVEFGVDEAFFADAPYPETPMLLSVGGDRDRDATTLFAALETIRLELPNLRIVVQTKSDARPPDGVEIVPYVTHRELRELYRQASVVTIATRDNLHVSGMTVSLEAMATGRPVVITDTPGMADYVIDVETGYTVPSGDSAALAERTLELLRDPAKAAQMGARGREFVIRARTTQHLADALAKAVAV